MIIFCKICDKQFSPRPSHVKIGWGVYCSRKCKSVGTSKKEKVFCFTCSAGLLKTVSQLKRSKSGKYFCNKSCQTKWRNREFVGPKHSNFKDGKNSYQSILRRHRVLPICAYCGEIDVRVLATHHVDEDHQNNNLKNLAWLCHNCHSLVHYDRLEKQKFLIKHAKERCK